MNQQKRGAVLVAGPASDYTQTKYGDYGDLLIQHIDEPSISWQKFVVYENHFSDDITSFRWVLITGSKFDAHGKGIWVENLKHVIRQAYQSGSKLLGICFGHQVLAEALGGASGRNPENWECGVAEMMASNDQTVLGCQIHGRPVFEMHQDCILQLPPAAINHAGSLQTRNQVMTLGARVLGIQGHPEFEADIVDDILESRFRAGSIPEFIYKPSKKSLENEIPKSVWQELIRTFLFDDWEKMLKP